MSTGVPLASVKTQIFEAVLGFLPDWVQITVLALVVLAVVASWVIKAKRGIARRRAARSGPPVQAPVPSGHSRGADFLGPYAPPRAGGGSGADHPGVHAPRQQGGQGSGADHLGPYAPPRQAQPSGADFLGTYAPQRGRSTGSA
ncbi:hypothetical protein AB0O68_18505 [Streptomyces sp. NPDC087512]|uniref:hypothetical protein n=1 Tax=Streptomyces sp. NPDC087512 TaxID=3155059 RepID=UPI003443494A